jgi:uncharacterized protein YjbI with pentapeptide repeats
VNSAGPGLAFLLLISVPLYWACMRPRRWRGRFTVGDLVIFPTSTFLQVGGIFVAFVIGSMLIYALLTQKRAEPQVLLTMILLFLVGLSVLFRQVELDPEGITVRYTWFTKRMRWSEIQSAHRLGNGSWLLLGGFRRMKLDRHYSDFELLVLGIASQLQSRQNTTQRLSYEDSCRHLQSLGLLTEGIMPVFPDRLPQFDDPQNYGIRFFRTHMDHTSDLSGLSLPRSFIGRSEVRGTLFVNSDLRQSNLTWNNFSHVDFSDAILAGSDLRSSFYVEVRFLRANLRGADLRLATFERCDFAEAAFENAILTRTQGDSMTLSDQQRAQIDWREDPGREPPGG